MDKNLFLLFAFLLLPLGGVGEGRLSAQTIGNEQGYMCNTPLPYLPYKLDVLFIGNSFSIDACTALPQLLRSSRRLTLKQGAMRVSNTVQANKYRP